MTPKSSRNDRQFNLFLATGAYILLPATPFYVGMAIQGSLQSIFFPEPAPKMTGDMQIQMHQLYNKVIQITLWADVSASVFLYVALAFPFWFLFRSLLPANRSD